MNKPKEIEYQKSLQMAREMGCVPVISCYYITRRCNYSCDYCSVRDNTSQDMPLAKALQVVDTVYMLGNRNLSITGGEPYLREDIFDVIAYASGKNMRVVSVSNGSILNSDKIRRMEEAQLDVLGLGMETVSSPQRAYGKHMDHKKRDLLEQLRGRSFNTVVAIVLNRQNYQEVPDMVDFYHSLGHGASVMMLIPNRNIPSDSPLLFRTKDIPQLEAVLARLKAMKQAGVNLNEATSYFDRIPPFIRRDFSWKCTPGLELSVMNDGRINLCTDMCVIDDTIFDIKSRDDFIKIVEANRETLERCVGCLWDYKMKPTESVQDPMFREKHRII